MNKAILKKCLEELSKESPSLPYVRGMLETMMEFLPQEPTITYTVPPAMVSQTPIVPTGFDEGSQMDRIAAAKTAEIKRLADASLS